MGEVTGISCADHTLNTRIGPTRVSPAYLAKLSRKKALGLFPLTGSAQG
jgi:hypothetical protein